MTTWSRRPTLIGGRTAPDDWSVLRDGVAVGRVHPRPYMVDGPKLTWSTWTLPSQSGSAETLEDALEAIRQAVEGLPDPEYRMAIPPRPEGS